MAVTAAVAFGHSYARPAAGLCLVAQVEDAVLAQRMIGWAHSPLTAGVRDAEGASLELRSDRGDR